MKIYVAGPMTGYENCNREAFNDKCVELSAQGHSVLNPATLPAGLTQAEYMDVCFAMIRAVDVLMFLPNWQASEGATAEYYYGKKLGLKLVCARTLEEINPVF
jgi:hypothetical protein